MANLNKAPHVDMLRSPLGRARGLGSAKAGAAHWWAQRLTAIALVPLTLWFICAVMRLHGADQAAVVAWLASPIAMVLMLSLIVATFHHLQLGLQVVVEDYVHDHALKTASVLALKGACIVLALACIVSVLKLGGA
jgi:succinate dehydrogenase / fumarate reductase, membrane anchor subunit